MKKQVLIEGPFVKYPTSYSSELVRSSTRLQALGEQRPPAQGLAPAFCLEDILKVLME